MDSNLTTTHQSPGQNPQPRWLSFPKTPFEPVFVDPSWSLSQRSYPHHRQTVINRHQINLIQDSWHRLTPVAGHAAMLFYAKLFQLEPALRPLFKGDIDEQGRQLTTVLSVAIHSLDRLERILPALQQLGQRHAASGICATHYKLMGAALLWTLAQALGPAFTPEVRQAWAKAYLLLAGIMQVASGHSLTAGQPTQAL